MSRSTIRAALRAGACLLALPAALAAQSADGVVVGRVLAAANGAPLPDVAVRIDGTTRGALSDAEGRFRIGAVPAGARDVVAQRIGLGAVLATVVVPAGDSVAVTLRMAERATVLAPTIVSASRELQRRADASATIDVLDGAELRAARPSHPADVMNRLAGVHVSVLSGEGHSMAIRQPITTKPVYLYLEDGVPTRSTGFFNHNALYEVNIPQSAGVEVLKGPGTALYGSDAIGGVVNVLTRPAPATPSAELSAEGGAFGYGRVLASGGFTHGHDGLRADLNLTRSDNWKDDAPFTRRSGTLRWDHFTSDGLTLRTVLTGSDIDQQDVPAISQQQFDDDRSLNRAPIAYRKVQALRLSTAAELARGATLYSLTPYARYDVLDLLPSWQLSYDPQAWSTKNSSIGFLAKVRRDFEPLRARVIAGADVDYSPGSFFADRIVTTAEGADRVYASYAAGEAQYDYDVTYRQLSPYAQVEISPISRLRLDAGLRYDMSGYVYDDNLEPLETGAHRRPASTSVSYRHASPKLGLTFDVGGGASLFASYRHGFRAPSQGQLFQQGSAASTVDLEPVTVNSYETGLRGQLGDRAVYQLSAYDMRISDDILTFITAENLRVASNAGETRHRGLEGSLGLALTPHLRFDGAYSIATQRYTEWVPQAAQPASGTAAATPAVSYGGNLIEEAPRDLGSAMLTYTMPALRGGRVALEWSHTGRYALDPANTHFYGGHELLNAYVNAMIPRYDLELFARGVNLLGRDYAELKTWDAFQHEQITPGAPRAVYAGVKYAWSR